MTPDQLQIDSTFPHNWRAEILPARPLILPPRHFVYPREAEEIERRALELLVTPGTESSQPFLATCALGFRDSSVPTGVWAAPNPDELCACSGGYAYLIDTVNPTRFNMVPYRPVLEIRPIPYQNLLLFVGHQSIFAWGGSGLAWESPKLSDEGVTIIGCEKSLLRGHGWEMFADKDRPFTLDLATGLLLP